MARCGELAYVQPDLGHDNLDGVQPDTRISARRCTADSQRWG
jgi:hypothetical protein